MTTVDAEPVGSFRSGGGRGWRIGQLVPRRPVSGA